MKIFEIEDENTGTFATQADKKSKNLIEEFVRINNPFVYNNLIYIFTQNKFVNVFNLENGNLLLKQSIKDFFTNNLIYPKPVKIERIEIKIPNNDRFPKLSNGLDYQHIFAEKMGFTHILNVEYEDFQKYRVYYFKVECSIDSSGHIGDIQVSSPDIKLKNKMYEFLSNSNFDTSLIPKGIEKWYFKDVPTFRNKTEEIAIKEREQDRASEKIKLNDRPASDSIDGIYIPIDLEDCFHQLDRILSMTDKEEFRKMSERDAVSHYHFSLGLWIRNNWGLWGNSRLKIYFKKIGVKNPDAMSGMILTSYHRFLNKKEIQIDEQIRTIIDAHEKN
jgi:Fe2+ or Zn2+ uptake regulation protein